MELANGNLDKPMSSTDTEVSISGGSSANANAIAAHPFRAYRLLRRFVKDLPLLEKELRKEEERSKNLIDIKFAKNVVRQKGYLYSLGFWYLPCRVPKNNRKSQNQELPPNPIGY